MSFVADCEEMYRVMCSTSGTGSRDRRTVAVAQSFAQRPSMLKATVWDTARQRVVDERVIPGRAIACWDNAKRLVHRVLKGMPTNVPKRRRRLSVA